MNDTTFGDFGDVDFTPKVPPPTTPDLPDQSIYPADARSPLFMDWTPHEEDLQCAALGWLTTWRLTNAFRIEGRKIAWVMPPEDLTLWKALEERMTDWAFLEAGGLDLDATHTMLLRRHQIRGAITPIQPLTTTPPASAGPHRKETPDVRKPQQGHSHRQPGPRPRAQNDPKRYGAVQILDSDD